MHAIHLPLAYPLASVLARRPEVGGNRASRASFPAAPVLKRQVPLQLILGYFWSRVEAMIRAVLWVGRLW